MRNSVHIIVVTPLQLQRLRTQSFLELHNCAAACIIVYGPYISSSNIQHCRTAYVAIAIGCKQYSKRCQWLYTPASYRINNTRIARGRPTARNPADPASESRGSLSWKCKIEKWRAYRPTRTTL